MKVISLYNQNITKRIYKIYKLSFNHTPRPKKRLLQNPTLN